MRPSGTAPKVKVHLEAILLGAGDPAAARAEAARRLAATRAAMETFTRT